MNCEKLKEVFNTNDIVTFKMYGLDYTIEKQENGIIIYANLYRNKNNSNLYSTIDDLLNNYNIYNENITSNDSRIQNIS